MCLTKGKHADDDVFSTNSESQSLILHTCIGLSSIQCKRQILPVIDSARNLLIDSAQSLFNPDFMG